MNTTLIVFSHLRWDFVYQRPQQLLSRLAAHRPVLFLEEPMGEASEPWLEQGSPCPGVVVLRPHVRGPARGFHVDHLEIVRDLLAAHVRASSIEHCLLWFYTPLALPFASGLPADGVVYDCMDELSAFRHAPAELIQREKELFAMADLVFTGGPSLYESKRTHHPHVHCFPSSVDSAHFGQVATCGDHPDQAAIGRPRLGYYGVIDERLDLGLVEALAEAHADWQIVMVGPVAKIDPASLPARPNIHWMGQRAYADLPRFLAGWDVCLMPFALNEATRFISPTKTLEYLAAGKPAVSTPIRDVAEWYANVVSIAATPEDFVQACERILARDDAEQRAFVRAAAKAIAATSWDRTASAMAELLQQLEHRRGSGSHATASTPALATTVQAPSAVAIAFKAADRGQDSASSAGAGRSGKAASPGPISVLAQK